MFRAILFDLDNTLIDRQAAFRLYAAGFCRRYLASLTPLEQHEAIEEMVVADDWGHRPRDQFCQWMSARFPESLLPACDVWEDFCRFLPAQVQPDSRIQKMLARLAGPFRLLVITNGSSRNQLQKLRQAQLGDYLTGTIVSGELGIEKPHPAIFEHALKIAGCSPTEALVVGDDPRTDIAGAKQSGLSAFWISHGRSYPTDTARPDQELSSVLDLERCLA